MFTGRTAAGEASHNYLMECSFQESSNSARSPPHSVPSHPGLLHRTLTDSNFPIQLDRNLVQVVCVWWQLQLFPLPYSVLRVLDPRARTHPRRRVTQSPNAAPKVSDARSTSPARHRCTFPVQLLACFMPARAPCCCANGHACPWRGGS